MSLPCCRQGHTPTAEATVSAQQRPGLKPEQLTQHFHFIAASVSAGRRSRPAPQNKTAVIVPPLSCHHFFFVLALKKQKILIHSDKKKRKKKEVFMLRRPRDLSCRGSHKAEVWDSELDGAGQQILSLGLHSLERRKLMTHSPLMPPCKLTVVSSRHTTVPVLLALPCCPGLFA